jgi:ribokinase
VSEQKTEARGVRISSVVVAGSLHYDIMVDAPDRPRKGETVAGISWSPKFGGKGGNQALASQGQGVPTAMVCAVGSDDFGVALLVGLDRGGVDRSAVATLSGVGSGMSVAIFDAEGDYGAVIVSGANLVISANQAQDELLRSAKVLILQNEIPEEINKDIARRAKQFGVTTILNAAPARAFETTLPGCVDILIVNAIEAEMLGSTPVHSLADAARAAASLTSRFAAVVVTAGGHGVAFQDEAGGKVSLPSIPVKVQSTHGAGDMLWERSLPGWPLGTTCVRLSASQTKQAAKLVSTPERERAVRRD